MKLGVLPLARPTFDVEFAEEKLAAMLAQLDALQYDIVGPRGLLFDAEATKASLEALEQASITQLLLLQVTFTDASMTVEAATRLRVPLSIWAAPEPRLGGRLRLNSFCGLNLASHALGLRGREFSWLYADPDGDVGGDLEAMFAGNRLAGRLDATPVPEGPDAAGRRVVETLSGKRIGRIGEHPEGFDTCAYSPVALAELSGVAVDEIELKELFDEARSSSNSAAGLAMQDARQALDELDEVDAGELDRSLRLKVALDGMRARGGYDAFAIRCWPETFTEYGGAVCGPVSMLGERKVPCACEADVYGALSQLLLQEASDAPVFLADLVDMDVLDNTGVVWHCGQAPISMCDPGFKARATVHSNRKMPLLFEFPLKAGRVTLMRVSQAFGETKLVIAGGDMLERPMAFTGTSGVVRFDRPVRDVLPDVLASGLEHHMALTYGDYRPLLRSAAAALGIPLLEL